MSARSIRYESLPCASGKIIKLVFDEPQSSTNIMNRGFREAFLASVADIVADEGIKGVILASAKDTFFAGGDLNELSNINDANKAEFFANIQELKGAMRQLETLGIPVVATLNGTALGGGWELALVAHHRIALANPKARFGLPEVTLGLLPGAGGVTKMVRILGIEPALPYLIEGKTFNATDGHKAGLINEIVNTEAELLSRAESFIANTPKSQQPFDAKGYKIPGGLPNTPKVFTRLSIAPAMLLKKTKGCFPAPEKILSCAVEGALVDVATALEIESRYLTWLANGPVAKNLINTMFFQLNHIKKGHSRPAVKPSQPFQKVGILGAGMMGAGIAYAAARSGFAVVLKDVSQEKAHHGKAYSEKLVGKASKKGRLTPDAAAAIVDRIHSTSDAKDLAGCDLVIEAVFEDRSLKNSVTKEASAHMVGDGVFASNTSTLPISGLAAAFPDPRRFVGLHFFSPVDKMQLVEIIRGKETSDETLARAFDFVVQIKKIPIVVNDSRGFFTSRVFKTFVNEGLAMLAEGQSPSLIEHAATLAGMPIGPLAVADEVSLSLIDSIRKQTEKDLAAEGKPLESHPGTPVATKMVALGRLGRSDGGGFYDYPEKGPKSLWSGLAKEFPEKAAQPLQTLKDRFLFVQSIETIKCLDEGVITSVPDANIGSIFGIGFAAWTGGALQFVNSYGLKSFYERAQELATLFGERFQPPQSLAARAEADKPYQ